MAVVARRKVDTSLNNQQLLAALRALRRGDFSVRLPRGLSGMDGELAEAFNEWDPLESTCRHASLSIL